MRPKSGKKITDLLTIQITVLSLIKSGHKTKQKKWLKKKTHENQHWEKAHGKSNHFFEQNETAESDRVSLRSVKKQSRIGEPI